ncbi:MAG: FAD:protein FMN transferase [Desulfomonile tiedjei]|nr:FAD:protein FMN transferase [Desulfomonile tiedjei]
MHKEVSPRLLLLALVHMGRWESRILKLGDDTVLVECGPMRMFIDGSVRGVRQPEVCCEAARYAIEVLEEIAACRPEMERPACEIPEPPENAFTRTMWAAALAIGDSDLTPMAAVAGTIADATAGYLTGKGLTRVIVNNGGDLAIHAVAGERIAVGIRSDVDSPAVTHRVVLSGEMGVCGVCTSGFGGRSFTRGIASAATVFASTAAIADAAATAIANATYLASPAVLQRPADTLYPDTDLKGVAVTVSVGRLTSAEVTRALARGIDRGEALANRGLIMGACVTVQQRTLCTARFDPFLKPL